MARRQDCSEMELPKLLPPWVQAGARVVERRRFAAAVAAARRLPSGARSPRASAELALAALGAQTTALDAAARHNPRAAALLSAAEARRHSPTRAPASDACLFASQATTGWSKAGTDGCGGACAAPSTAALRGQSAVPGGPVRRIYAAARSAPTRSHRSRPDGRGAQGTEAEGGGAASKPPRPSAPALPLHSPHASPSH